GEAAERIGAVEAAGDEQERQASREPKQEADEVGAPSASESREVASRPLAGRRGVQAPGPSVVSGRARSSPAMLCAGAPSSSRTTASVIGMSMLRRRARSSTTGAVWAPSATVRLSLISALASPPWPSALPSEKLRLEVEEQVSTRSPRPQRPASVAR